MTTKLVLAAAAFALGAGAIAYGVLTDARDARAQALLASLEGAEERFPHDGVRRMTAGDADVLLRIWIEGGRRRVQLLEARGPRKEPRVPKIPHFVGFPAILRPAHVEWWRRIKDARLAVRNYEVEVGGREIVAGRPADVIDLRPIRPGRASYRIWADRENRFPLGFQVLWNGNRVFETRFEEIAFRDGPPAPKRPEPWRPAWLKVSREEAPPREVASRAGFAVWTPAVIPAGFELRRSELWSIGTGESAEGRPAPLRLDGRVVHLNYTDGLAVLSVVECSADSPLWKLVRRFAPPGAAEPGGRVVAQRFADRGGSVYLLELEGTVILAAGNVPPAEMEAMLRTLRKT